MESAGDDGTIVTAEGGVAVTEQGDTAKTSTKERGTSPPATTKETRARIPTMSASSSTSDQEEFLSEQAAACAAGSVTPQGHRTTRSGSSSDDHSFLASLARIEARFEGIDLKQGALTQAERSGTQPACWLEKA